MLPSLRVYYTPNTLSALPSYDIEPMSQKHLPHGPETEELSSLTAMMYWKWHSNLYQFPKSVHLTYLCSLKVVKPTNISSCTKGGAVNIPQVYSRESTRK